MASRDIWPGIPSRYDDVYYESSDARWEVMFMWDSEYNEYATIVHPVYGTHEIRNPQIIAALKAGILNGFSL